MKVFAIIVAGGKGKRFQKKEGKQFFEIEGKPVLFYTISKFLKAPSIDHVLPVINEYEMEKYQQTISLLEDSGKKLLQPAFAGKERFFSVLNGLNQIKKFFPEDFESSVVLIHDGARPLVSVELIEKVVNKTKEKGACVPVLSLADTVKEVNNEGKVLKTLNRDALRAVQTPQGFHCKLIYECYLKALEENCISFTDDAGVVENFGKEVWTVEGERTNIKLTYPEDELFAILFLKKMGDKF